MVDCIISIKDPIITTLAILNNSEVVCLSPQDWVVLEHARNILKIFYDVTVEISAEKYVSISKEIIFIKMLNKCILNFINDDTMILKRWHKILKQNFIQDLVISKTIFW